MTSSSKNKLKIEVGVIGPSYLAKRHVNDAGGGCASLKYLAFVPLRESSSDSQRVSLQYDECSSSDEGSP